MAVSIDLLVLLLQLLAGCTLAKSPIPKQPDWLKMNFGETDNLKRYKTVIYDNRYTLDKLTAVAKVGGLIH